MASANDMKSATQTYNNFLTMLKWATPITAFIVFVVILLIA